MKNLVSRKKMNMEKIARLAGVSRTTVSVVLRQHQGLPVTTGNIRVSDETRDRVLKTIVNTGYQPNPIGQALVSGKSFIVGLIVTSISDSFIHSFIEATEDEAERNNYGVMLATTRSVPARELQAIKFMLSKRVDGIIMSSSSIPELDPQLQETIRTQNVSIVYLSYQPAHVMEKAGAVYVDARVVAELGIGHLSNLGHKNVACVISSPSVRDFIISLAHKENVSVQFWPRGDTQEDTLKRWKQSNNKPTALFFEEDKMAIEFENFAVRAGVNIPRDVSVMGIDNIPEAATAVVPLTTVEQPQYEQGLAATRVLFDMIRGKEPQHVVLQPKLVTRKSTSAPRYK